MSATWTAAGGALSSGGKLVLTTQRLLFEPMRTPKDALLGPLAKLLGAGEIGGLANKAIDATGVLSGWAIPLSEIVAVEPIADSAKLRVTMRSGESRVVVVSAGLWSLRGATENVTARDEAVNALRTALPQGGAVAGPPAAAVEQVVDGEPTVRAHEVPGGLYVEMVGAPDRPPTATEPASLAGEWSVASVDSRPGQGGESVVLLPDGGLTGRLWLFGAIPPVPIAGRWWLEPGGRVVLDYTATVETGEGVLTMHQRFGFDGNGPNTPTLTSPDLTLKRA
ncbi:MAG TPA: hypothetical protein VJT75_01110 [Thermoleophilaceae bacterium]|nr:hypothetical protein [Thermoleophilaceae bacterium]